MGYGNPTTKPKELDGWASPSHLKVAKVMTKPKGLIFFSGTLVLPSVAPKSAFVQCGIGLVLGCLFYHFQSDPLGGRVKQPFPLGFPLKPCKEKIITLTNIGVLLGEIDGPGR